MVPTFDVIVLGLGSVGSAAVATLASRGLNVLGIDRFAFGHEQGSSHGHTRIIRQAYFEHADYVPLLLESYRLWHELEAQAGEQLLFPVGLVEIGPADGEVVPGVLRAAQLHGLDIQSLDPQDIPRRFPGLQVGQAVGLVGVFEPAAGYLLVERAIACQIALARRRGATLQCHETVESWRADGGAVRVHTHQGEYSAGRLIIAGGAWSESLLGGLGTRLRVLRKQVHWWRPRSTDYDVAAGAPTFLYELPEGCFYGFPQMDGLGVKVAEHSGGQPVPDPLAVDRSLDLQDRDRVSRFCRDYLPGLSDELLAYSVCLYTMTPDGHFIVDRHPDHRQVAFAAGLSGHGFKFAPTLGKLLAELALEGRATLPIEFLSCRRPSLA